MGRGLLALAFLIAVLTAPGTARAAAANPTVTIPPAGIRGYPLWDSWWDLSEAGYEEHEYFLSGTAENVERTSSAPYTTRIIVTRPSDPEDWNGAVLLDWVNVTAQFENPVDSLEARELLLREGWAWVHVSAQAAGISPVPLLTPKTWDPVRYAALSHPGDDYADNIYSQVAQALKSPMGIDPLGGMPGPRRLIAAGQSQSAGRLDRYVRDEHRKVGVIDAFLIHGGGSKDHGAEGPDSPVLHLLSDREATRANPTSTNNYRLWEVAGTAHSDFWIGYAQVLGSGPRWLGVPKRSRADSEKLDRAAGNYGEQLHPLHAICVVAGAAFPMRYAVSAALHYLNRWVADGTPPPTGPRFRFSGTSLARDADGNALGGIRLPPIDVPVARYVSTACELGGVTVPFTELELLLRYPTHANYYARMVKKTNAAVASGFLLPEDAIDLLRRACAARNRWLDFGGGSCD